MLAAQVVYLSEAASLDLLSAAEVYPRFLLIWPLFFGLVVFLGTLVLAWTCDPRQARILWWMFAGLIAVHTMLLAFAFLMHVSQAEVEWPSTWQEIGIVGLWLIPTIGLPVLLLATFRFCHNWFYAAMWMQLALALTAAVSATVVLPLLLLAREVLVGGKLMIVTSVGLIVFTIVQQIDGYRALTRKPDQSPLQLSLRSMLLLMAVGGLACAWVGACLFI